MPRLRSGRFCVLCHDTRTGELWSNLLRGVMTPCDHVPMTNTEHSLTIAYGYVIIGGEVMIAEMREDGSVIFWTDNAASYADETIASADIAGTFTTTRP